LTARVFVVDSGSTDRTRDIAAAAGCGVVEHPFEHYAAQRNWALDNLPLEGEWVLCLDADERLTPELAAEIEQVVARDGDGCDGFLLNKRTVFLGKWIRHGGQYPSYHQRLFRRGKGRCENRLYDQHFTVVGKVGRLRHDYIDIIASDLTTWTARHNRWATLEAEELLRQRHSAARNPIDEVVQPNLFGTPIQRKRYLRQRVYQRFPLFVRPFLFWFYGYVLRLGWLDGTPGLIFHTLQRFWFRFLVDAKLYELRRR
jgi:glycosyltransferase involved in cell wall biosynthesis